MTGMQGEALECACAAVGRLRGAGLKVHALTNFVAQHITANVLLASGVVPSMTMDAAVMDDFVESADALLVNLGMLDPWRRESIPVAVEAAGRLGRPWVLDPVKVDRAGARLNYARALLEKRPAILRCNRSEIAALAGGGSAQDLAGRTGTVIAVTGEIDEVSCGERRIGIANGSPLMDKVTAMGCAGSAVLAAMAAVEDDPFIAALAGLLLFNVAGDIAAGRARGPGSFEAELLDALYALDPATIRERARLT